MLHTLDSLGVYEFKHRYLGLYFSMTPIKCWDIGQRRYAQQTMERHSQVLIGLIVPE